MKATDINNENEYRDYRLNVKKRLNIPYRKKENDEKKQEAAFKKSNPQTSNVITSRAILEDRMKILEKEYNELEDQYATIIKRLENAGEQ